jgi:hypothetical protein
MNDSTATTVTWADNVSLFVTEEDSSQPDPFWKKRTLDFMSTDESSVNALKPFDLLINSRDRRKLTMDQIEEVFNRNIVCQVQDKVNILNFIIAKLNSKNQKKNERNHNHDAESKENALSVQHVLEKERGNMVLDCVFKGNKEQYNLTFVI